MVIKMIIFVRVR